MVAICNSSRSSTIFASRSSIYLTRLFTDWRDCCQISLCFQWTSQSWISDSSKSSSKNVLQPFQVISNRLSLSSQRYYFVKENSFKLFTAKKNSINFFPISCWAQMKEVLKWTFKRLELEKRFHVVKLHIWHSKFGFPQDFLPNNNIILRFLRNHCVRESCCFFQLLLR